MSDARDERPRFRPERPASATPRGQMALLVLLLLAVGAGLALRPLWEPGFPDGALVEVTGEVPRPGTYLLDEPTVAAAVAAAGGDPRGFATEPVPPGHRVVVDHGEARVAAPSEPLLVALPVDVNEASAVALSAIPGIGPSLAEAIVAGRSEGPYAGLDDLLRVPGLGPGALEQLRPFATAGEASAGPVDLNRATAAELERLPGVGPVTAARIVVDREDHGPYESLEDLARVRGIGPALLDGLRDRVVVR